MKLSYDEFLTALSEVVYDGGDSWREGPRPEVQRHIERIKSRLESEGISTEWCVDGRTGGSCWDTEPAVYSSVRPDPEPDLPYLDALLERLTPSMSFLHYRQLAQLVVKEPGKSYNDYYGNYSSYEKKSLRTDVLYSKLVSLGYIEQV